MTEDTISFGVEKEEAERRVKELEDALKSLGKEFEEFRKKSQDQAKASKSAKQGFDELKKSAAALGVSYLTLKTGIIDSLKAFAEQDAAAGRLLRSYKNVGGGLSDFKASVVDAQKSLDKYGISVNDTYEAKRRLLDITGSKTKANQDYALAVNIAAQESISLKEATDFLKKAREGDTGVLKDLGIANKGLEEDLNRINSETDLSSELVDILSTKYAEAASETKGLSNEADKLKGNLNQVQVQLGSLISTIGSESGGFIGSLMSAVGVDLGDDETGLKGLANVLKELRVLFLGATADVGIFAESAATALDLTNPATFVKGLAGLDSKFDEIQERGQERLRKLQEDAAKRDKENLDKTLEAKRQAQEIADKALAEQNEKSFQEEFRREEERATLLQQAYDEQAKRDAERRAEEDRRKKEEEAREYAERLEIIRNFVAEQNAITGDVEVQELRNSAERQSNEYAAEKLRLEARILEIKNEGLRADQEAAEIAAAQIGYQKRVADISAKETAASEKAAEKKKKSKEEALDLEKEQRKKILGLISEGGKVSAAATAVASSVQGAYHAAEGVGKLFANPIEAAQHFVASAQHFSIAAKWGAGGGGSSGGAPASVAAPSVRNDSLGADNANATRGGTTQVININNRSILSPTPEEMIRVAKYAKEGSEYIS